LIVSFHELATRASGDVLYYEDGLVELGSGAAQMDTQKNVLRIDAKSLQVELSGDESYVIAAYEALRPVLVKSYRESLHGPRRVTEKIAAVGSSPASIHVAERTHFFAIWFSSIYHKVLMVRIDDMKPCPLSCELDFSKISRLYVDRENRDRIPGFPKGKVLWRELTEAGKSAMRGPR
jgi:hypothetical protein